MWVRVPPLQPDQAVRCMAHGRTYNPRMAVRVCPRQPNCESRLNTLLTKARNDHGLQDTVRNPSGCADPANGHGAAVTEIGIQHREAVLLASLRHLLPIIPQS